MNDILKALKARFPTRHSQLMAFLVVLAVILVSRLFVVTVFQHEKWKENADSLSTKTIYTTAPRGEIYDRNGSRFPDTPMEAPAPRSRPQSRMEAMHSILS